MSSDIDAAVSTYVEAASPPGSIDYYLLLFSPHSLRDRLSAALALGKVITNIAVQQTEYEIRQLKLHWWLEEIERTGRGQPRHPLTCELTQQGPAQQWLPQLRTVVDASLQDLDQSRLETLKAVLPFCHRQATKQSLLAAVHPECTDNDLSNARACGVGRELTLLLARQEPRFDGASFELAPAEAYVQLASVATQHFEAMERTDASHETIWLQASLYRLWLQRLCKSNFDTDQANVGPLRLLWQAWRQARKLRR